MKTAAQLRKEADALHSQANRLNDEAAKLDREAAADRLRANEKIPVCRDSVTLTDGTPVSSDHREIDPATGMQKGYVVLSAEERAKGFVRPARRSYVHDKCGTVTTMGQTIAETYARDPKFYGGTFCAGCGTHFPVGEDGQFVWDGTSERVGT